MKKDINQSDNNNSEEIDLGQLFRLIGEAFNKVGKLIERFFLLLFKIFIEIIFFFKQNIIKITCCTIIFGGIGYMLDRASGVSYYSKMLVQPNYGTSFQLYSNVEYYNELAKNRDSLELAEIFNISITEALDLKSFEITPGPESENEKLLAYDEFIKTSDPITVSMMTFKDFKKQVNIYNSLKYEIIVESKQRNIFSKLEESIVKGINFNSYIKTKQSEELISLKQQESDVKESLERLDSLTVIYGKVLIAESNKQNNATTSIDLGGGDKTQTKELEVLALKSDYKKSLRSIKKEIVDKENIVNIISSFQLVGSKKSGFFKKTTILLALTGFLLIVSLLLIKELNIFLNKYKLKKEQ